MTIRRILPLGSVLLVLFISSATFLSGCGGADSGEGTVIESPPIDEQEVQGSDAYEKANPNEEEQL